MANTAKIIDTIIFCIIIIFAFIFSIKSGERGFFPLDQSIVFDGAYRIIQGQIPYKDFLMPFGPVVFWIQAIFFKIFGINYFSYLLFSAISNAIGAFCSILILRILFPGRKILSYIAGILTGIWFYPPFGTPWLEQTSFLFSFFGLLFILTAINTNGNTKKLLIVLSGVVSVLSILSKQNAGLFILPIFPILLWLGNSAEEKNNWIKLFLLFSTGFIVTFLLFFIWLLLFSNFEIFIQYFIKIPSDIGFQRLFHNPSPILVDFFTGRGLTSSRLVVFVFLMISFYFLIRYLVSNEFQKGNRKILFIACVLYIYLTFYQNIFNHLTCNQDVNGFPFMGILLAIGTGFSIELFESRTFKILQKHGIRRVVFTGVIFALFFTGMRGIEISLTRRVQDIFGGSVFSDYCAEEKLKNLKWGMPTMIEKTNVSEQSISQLIGYLKSKKENFFIFPDFTILYGLIGVTSPQPLLWFQKEWTYTREYDSRLDEWIIKDLKKNNIRIIVIEEKSFLGTENRLNDFPLLKNFINENFQLKEKFGIFGIYLSR